MRKLVIALMVLIIVVAALLGLALYNLDSLIASYKDRIVVAAERRTGRKVAYDRINVKLRGGIGVRIRGLSITEDPAFGSDHFLRAADVQVNLGIHPLRRQVSVTRVVLRKPAMKVIRNEQGVYNFTGLGARLTADRVPAAVRITYPFAVGTAEAQQPPPVSGFGGDLAVSRIDVFGGTLDYRDERDRRQLALRELDLEVDDLSLDRPFKVTLATALLEDRQNVRFDGRMGPVRPGPHGVAVDGTVEIDTLSWDSVREVFPEIFAGWHETLALAGTLRTQGLALKGTPKDMAVRGALDFTHSGLKYGDAFDKPPGTALRLEVDARATPESIAVKRLDATLDSVNVKGDGDVGLGSPATVDFSLALAAAELQGWDRWAPPLADYKLSGHAEAKAEVTGELGGGVVPRIHGTLRLREAAATVPALEEPLEALSAAVEFSNHGATLRQLSFRIGETRLAGKAALESFTPFALNYRLASPSLRLADLRLQPQDGVLEGARGSGRLAWDAGLSFEGRLTSDKGKLLGLDFTGLTAGFDVTEERLAVRSFRLKTLGGSLDANGGMQLQGTSPRFEVAARMKDIDIRQYLAGMAGIPEVAGTLNADVSATGRGRTWDAIKSTLAGKGTAAVVEGRLLEVNLAEQALEGMTGISGLTSLFGRGLKDKYPKIFKKETTTFEQLDAEVRAAGGRVVVERVTLRAADYGIAGKGWIELDGVTDLEGVLTLSEDLSADLLPGSRLTPITNHKDQIEVPFNVKGTLPDVSLRPRLRLIESLLEKTVGRGVKGVLDLIPGADAQRGRKDREKREEKPQEPPPETDPVQKLIERALKLFGGER